jgi:hypothetical protein
MTAKNPENPDNLAPETFNDEQDDEQSQAQEIAEDALSEDDDSPTESTKPRKGAFDEDSTQDLVDHMRDMESSGRIDMGAFQGEDNHDDNEDKYGEDNKVDPDLPSDGS